MSPLTSSISIQFAAALLGVADFTTPTAQISKSYGIQFGDGVGANQADKIIHKQRTIAASANDDLDLAGLLTDAFGVTVTMVKVKGILIASALTNANNIIYEHTASLYATMPEVGAPAAGGPLH